MKERRKIFSAADVAAIKDGRKTMFREMVGKRKHPFGTIGDRIWIPEAHQFLRETCSYECEEYDLFEWEHDLYGSPKDHLLTKCPRGGHRAVIGYADEEDMEDWEMRPSITMPRWACRTFAEITTVRVEQVADITEEDARNEGIMESEAGRAASKALATYKRQDRPPLVLQFADLWQSRYGNWDTNPFVWVYSIKLIKP